MTIDRRAVERWTAPCIVLAAVTALVPSSADDATVAFTTAVDRLYERIEFDGELDPGAFELAITGYANLLDRGELARAAPLSIIDYTKPSTERRLFVVDVPRAKLLRSSLVAHGKNTGEDRAVHFSDEPGSLKSSFGFFATGETYYGQHDYSLRLHGLERGINDNALERFIVMHGAWYVSDEFIDRHGRLGRSWGCPALPLDVSAEIIDLIKGGSGLYVHAGDPEYVRESGLLDRDRAAAWFSRNGARWSTDGE